MKTFIKKALQKTLGFNNYLFIFSIYIHYTLKFNKKEGDFLYFLKMISDKDIVLDIGANIGIMTTYLAKNLKNAKIYCFEPMPDNIYALKRIINHFKLKNVKIFETALGNKDSEIEMVMPVIKSVKMQGLSHVVHDSIKELNEGIKFKTTLQKLDSIKELNEKNSKINAIKMDVENFEYFVLQGGQKLLKRDHPLVYCELWENENRDNCIKLMSNLGYNTKILQANKLIDFDENNHKTQNFFFTYNK